MKKFIGLALLNVYLNYQRAGYSLDSAYIECGGAAFPKGIVTVAHVTYLFIQIVVPIMLIILGMLDFGKASIAKDQNQIAKKQKVFVKRLIAAGIVFFVATIADFVVVAVSSSTKYTSCVACLTKGENYCGADMASPNIPDYPGNNGSFNDSDFVQPDLKLDDYDYDPDDDTYGTGNPSNGGGGNNGGGNNGGGNNGGGNYNGDLSSIGIGSDPNETAAPVGTTVPEPQGREVKALFTAYYPANDTMQGGFNDCKGHPLQPNKQTAAAPKSVPYGSIMYIKSIDGGGYQNYVGRPYVVTDVGGAINIVNGVYHFDLLHPDRTSAYSFGKRTGTAIIVER